MTRSVATVQPLAGWSQCDRRQQRPSVQLRALSAPAASLSALRSGQLYCPDPCARQARRECLRDAGRRYQASFRGRLHHARRQSRWRERQREKVTHQRFLDIESDASVDGHKEVDNNAQSSMAMETSAPIGGGNAAAMQHAPAWKSPTRGAVRGCAWCGVSATRLVRLQRWQR